VPVGTLLEFPLAGEGSTLTAWKIIGVFMASQLAFMKLLPGARFEGPVTEHGNVPVYKVNGLKSFLATQGLFCLGVAMGWWNGGIFYDHYEKLIGCMNVFALGFCGLLSLKGLYFPSSTDAGSTGPGLGGMIQNYYWGTELYPRILGWDVKVFTNCRFGMMIWPLLCVSYAFAQHERGGVSDSMLVSVGIQLVYVAKFFWWESGYWCSVDIHLDRAGFYICWGCLVWVPSLYTSHTLYLVQHPYNFGTPMALFLFAIGVAAVMVNYFADAQRVLVRRTDGKCLIWGAPPKLIRATYTTSKGEKHSSLLLASGWWGVSRHSHYIFELTAAFLWCAPARDAPLAYAYFIFLTILLVDRSFRDDYRCAAKYGADWEKYKKLVPWKIIPGIL
jgi:7-dehydrocholesterol reductase